LDNAWGDSNQSSWSDSIVTKNRPYNKKGDSMRTLNSQQLESVEGGLELVDAAAMIASISSFSPVTMAFGYPIAAALVTIEVLSE
jgi:hypothetical protein